jgi:hypothetical protein
MQAFKQIWNSQSYLHDAYDRNLTLRVIFKPNTTRAIQYQHPITPTSTASKISNVAQAIFFKISLTIVALFPCGNRKITRAFHIVTTLKNPVPVQLPPPPPIPPLSQKDIEFNADMTARKRILQTGYDNLGLPRPQWNLNSHLWFLEYELLQATIKAQNLSLITANLEELEGFRKILLQYQVSTNGDQRALPAVILSNLECKQQAYRQVQIAEAAAKNAAEHATNATSYAAKVKPYDTYNYDDSYKSPENLAIYERINNIRQAQAEIEKAQKVREGAAKKAIEKAEKDAFYAKVVTSAMEAANRADSHKSKAQKSVQQALAATEQCRYSHAIYVQKMYWENNARENAEKRVKEEAPYEDGSEIIIRYEGGPDGSMFVTGPPSKLREWWKTAEYQLEGLVFKNEDWQRKPNQWLFRPDYSKIRQGTNTLQIFKARGFTCEGEAPPKSITQYIQDNPEKSYKVGENSYQIVRSISHEGVYGNVYLARDITTKKNVAIKILNTPTDKEDEMFKLIQKRGGHPNVVQYIGSSSLLGRTWIAMEYLDGIMLGDYRHKHGYLTPELADQYTNALNFIRDAGVTSHRENDQDNVMITRDAAGKERLVLIDFGTLARA